MSRKVKIQKPNYEEADGEEEDEEESSITRKRKDENCNLEEPSSKKSKNPTKSMIGYQMVIR